MLSQQRQFCLSFSCCCDGSVLVACVNVWQTKGEFDTEIDTEPFLLVY